MTMRRAVRLVGSGGGFREMQDSENHPPHTVVPFTQDSDPGAVGAGRMWLDTAAGGVLWKIRNDANTGWHVLAGQRVRTESGAAYEVALGDDGHLLRLDDAAGVTLTLPEAGDTGQLPVGAQVLFSQEGTGPVLVVPAEYVTLQAEGDRLETTGQHAVAGAVVVAVNTWLVFGNLQVEYAG